MAKRVNTRFLVLLTTVVLGGGVLLMAVRFAGSRFVRQDADKLLAESRRLEAAGDVDGAIARHDAAVRARSRDADLRVALGDLYYRHVAHDVQNLAKARLTWESALAVNDKHPAAMRRLLDVSWEQAKLSPRPESFTAVRTAAARFRPGADGAAGGAGGVDVTAAAREQIVSLMAAEAGVPTPREQVEAAVAALRDLATRAPADAEIAFWVGRGELHLASLDLQEGESAGADPARRAAAADQGRQALARLETWTDAMLKGQDANAAMQFAAARLYIAMSALDGIVKPPAPTVADDANAAVAAIATARRGRYGDRVDAALAAARAAVKPADREYADVQFASAEWLDANSKPADAARLLEEVVTARGDDGEVRLRYARLVARDPARREKAIELLSRPVDLAGAEGVRVLARRELQGMMLVELANVRLAAVAAERDPAKRAPLLDQFEADVTRVEQAANPQWLPLIELKGQLALQRGRLADAITQLQTVVDRRGGPSGPQADHDLVFVLAKAYFAAGQTGQAVTLLEPLVGQFPDHVPARSVLIEALMRDGRTDAARAQLAELRRRDPKAAQGLGALAAAVEGGAARDAFVGQMAEATPADKVKKAAALRGEGKAAEAIELARAAFEQDATHLPAVEQLLELYAAAGRREEALDAARKAIAANPDNAALKRVPERLAQDTPEALDAWRLEAINAEPNAFARALKLFDFHAPKAAAAAAAPSSDPAAGKANASAAEAERQLVTAEQLKPGDVNVATRRFELMLALRRFDDAAAVLPKLAAANSDGVNGEVLKFRLAMGRPDLAAAEAAAREVVRQRPQFAQGHQILGQVKQVQGQLREAVAAYGGALARQGRNYDALRGLIETHLALNEPAEAKAALDRARALFPNDAAIRGLAMNYEAAHGDPAAVVAERERAFKAAPEVADNALALAEAYLLAPQRTAGADPARTKDALAKARKVLEDATSKWPGDARFHWPLAQVLAAQGDVAAGERLLKSYAARPDVTDKAGADVLLAEYYNRAGRPADAEQSLRAALEKSGGGTGAGAASVRQQLAAHLSATGRQDEAVQQLEGLPGPAAARQRVAALLAAGKVAEADKAVRAAVAADPTSADTADLLLETLLNAGGGGAAAPVDIMPRLAEAEKLIAERLAKSAVDESARYFSALLKFRRRPPDLAAATRELGELLNRNPRAVNARALLAEVHRVNGDVAAAIEELGRVLEAAPLNRAVRIRLIEWCSAARRWDAVLKVTTEAANLPPIANDPLWHRHMAAAFASNGKTADALRAITRAMDLTPGDALGDVHVEHLALLLEAEAFPKVLAQTDAWIAKGAGAWWVHRARGLARYGAEKDVKGALAEFDAALAALDPAKQFVAADSVVRNVDTVAGRPAALERVLKLVDAEPRWRTLAAEYYIKGGDHAAALAQLEPLTAGPARANRDVMATAYRLESLAHHTRQPTPDFEKAKAAYLKYLELRPTDAFALNNLAYMLAEEMAPPNLAEAKVYSQRAYEIAREWEPGEPKGRVLDTHGWVLVLNGGSELEQGVRVLEEVVDESPFIDAHYHLGEGHLRRKRGEDAEEQLTIALAKIDKAKAEKQAFDEGLESRVKQALAQAKALNAAAGTQ